MIRKVFKKKPSSGNKIDTFLEKYNLPKAYLAVNRRMITRGVGVGLFWAFIPMPMQMLAVMATTPFMRFNVPIAISMVWLSNPFTMPPMYYMEYITGNFILGREGIEDIELTMAWFSENFDDILVPLYVGTSFYSIVVTAIIYVVLNRLWVNSVHSENKERKHKRRKKINKTSDTPEI
ncbi:MAG: DUF2062 domain-containing protein [Sulfurovum sp.]|uniref:DUF2062 domain-containing protein n=1 Tax=Sulfurovum sp. TaxID=1969726 RepID=UPI0028680C0E|nr:DUF2062 domain-containing protein [Sulfurovum sp.]MCO4844463.1 DUF2062 domain-containing protein [Sulfurovum sp.]